MIPRPLRPDLGVTGGAVTAGIVVALRLVARQAERARSPYRRGRDCVVACRTAIVDRTVVPDAGSGMACGAVALGRVMVCVTRCAGHPGRPDEVIRVAPIAADGAMALVLEPHLARDGHQALRRGEVDGNRPRRRQGLAVTCRACRLLRGTVMTGSAPVGRGDLQPGACRRGDVAGHARDRGMPGMRECGGVLRPDPSARQHDGKERRQCQNALAGSDARSGELPIPRSHPGSAQGEQGHTSGGLPPEARRV